MVYTWYIQLLYWYGMFIVLFSGFRGTHCPPAPPSHGIEDNTPDANDEADFDIPYTQAVLERFMSRFMERFWKHILPRAWACAHRYYQECGASHKQQGRFPLHSALSLPPWAVAAVRTAAGRHGWAGWGSRPSIGSNSNGKGLDWWQKFQHFLRIGCALSYAAGHDK